MSSKKITRVAMLASILYIIQFIGSGLLYVELVNFTILLYGVSLERDESYLAVAIFCFLVMLTRGFGLWTIMYLVVFPQYAFIYSTVGKRIRSEYALSLLGFFLAFICGTLIDIPYIIAAGLDYNGLIVRLLLGFQVSIVNALVTFVATLFLLNPLKKLLLKLNT
ncbi:hypothetical protein E8P77_12755 [Soehngenia saccharolytica]|nr:hypothetical protein E8P77_12755 [Soehngenia saccharolytica]